MAQIICKNLIVGYEGQVVRDNINFVVNKGDYLCIVGENGSGKTTLMKTLLSLQKPMGGEIIFGDGLNANEIGYLPQQSTIKRDFPATNFEIVLSGNLGHSGFFYSKDDKELALKAMKRLHVDQFKDRCFRELSGGQQQRVLLARALCATQKVLLLDEPVSGLDPKVTAEMYELVKELNQNDNITIIMISHDLNDALKYATHILHVGSVVFFGTKNDYLNSELGKQFVS
ncbi:MAG: metal ABC transporter ATP-binding protein [Lachnospiraceae bacterium]|nr:metal ABC transporter ATP-binding protein [Lachnospiraceae bacterium]